MAKKESNCTICGVYIKYEDSRSSGKYCSNKCQGVHLRQQSFQKVEAGLGSSDALRNYLLEKHGAHCWTCKITEWMGKPVSFHLDHIDGNSDNNVLANARMLCPTCHSQTETYCGKNKKNTKRNRYLQVYKSEMKQKR